MATNDNEDPSTLSDEELDARQRTEDGEDPNFNPADEADADATASAAATAAAAPAATPEPAATPAPTPEPVAATAAGSDGKVTGVMSKDGERVLPYGALQAARRDARREESRAERAERELAEANQRIADLKAGKASTELTEEEVADMEANFPDQGKKLRSMFERAKASSPAPAPATVDEPGDDPVQDAIDQVPLLLKWQHEEPKLFARTVEHDAVLMKSPKWADKPAVERFAEAARRTADEFDIQFEAKKNSTSAAPAATPAPASIDAAQAAQRKPPETLSDFKGGATAAHDSLNERASPREQLNRFMDMTDEQIDAQLAKLG